MSPLALATLALLVALSSAQLFVYEAGLNGAAGPQVTDGTVICPVDYGRKGFTLRCVGSADATTALFRINGNKVRKDKIAPFHIFGDKKSGKARRWKTKKFSGALSVSCKLNDGTTYEADIVVSCDVAPPMTPSASPSSSPSASAMAEDGEFPPSSMIVIPSGDVDKEGTLLKDGDTICPDDFEKGLFTVKCFQSDTSTSARFFIDNAQERFEGKAPYFIAGDNGDTAKPWLSYPVSGSFDLKCTLSDGASTSVNIAVTCDDPSITTPPSDDADDDGVITNIDPGCVVIDAKRTELSAGWTLTADGVEFRRGDTSLSITGAGKFPLSYKFVAPLTTMYGFVIDMTTRDGREHNDIWAKFPDGGFQLMRGGLVNQTVSGMGWKKIYHNANGRAAVSSTVDFYPHSLATKDILEEGVEYEILLSGRSSLVIAHKIIFFPCDGNKCQRGSSFWQNRLAKCTALNF